MTKLAIVIPYYKIDYFEETIKSLANQTNQNFSIYIGNDCSKDNPLPIINKYLAKDRYSYFDYKENLGGQSIARQWERILEHVDEEWFQILGDDDSLSSNFVEQFYKHVNDFDSVNVVKVVPQLINANGELLNEYTKHNGTGYYHSLDLFYNKFYHYMHCSLSEHIFRNAAYCKVGFEDFPLAWHTDDYLILRACDLGEIFFISTTYVLIRKFDNSISGNTNNYEQKSIASTQFFNKITDLVKIKTLTKDQKKQIREIYHINWRYIKPLTLVNKLGFYRTLKIFVYEYIYTKFKNLFRKLFSF